MPRCRHCKDKFTSRFFNQKYCMYKDECIKAHSDAVQKKIRDDEDKKWQKIKKEKKEALMTLSGYKNKLQPLINLIVRLIDKGKPCMMCGNVIKKSFGCHFHSVGSNDTIRFHLLNIWGGCYSCNNMKGGNLLGYQEHISHAYGKEKLEVIQYTIIAKNAYLGLERDDIKELIVIAKQIIKELESLDMEYTDEIRWKLREKYNKRLDIYI